MKDGHRYVNPRVVTDIKNHVCIGRTLLGCFWNRAVVVVHHDSNTEGHNLNVLNQDVVVRPGRGVVHFQNGISCINGETKRVNTRGGELVEDGVGINHPRPKGWARCSGQRCLRRRVFKDDVKGRRRARTLVNPR